MTPEQTSFVSIKPPVRLDASKLTNWRTAPYVLGKCKEASLAADMSHRFWNEFSTTARSCFGPEASEEEQEKFFAVVHEWFEVTKY